MSVEENLKFEPPDKRLNLEPGIFIRAKEGDSFAQLDVGKAYYDNPHVNDNLINSLNWITMAAQKHNGEAQFKLGDLYAFGQGVEKDEFIAYDWYLKSAIQGYPKSLTRIHNLYHSEVGMYCRGKRGANEDEWATAEFKTKNKIRELNEYRIEQIKPELTKIKDYFLDRLATCRKQVKEENEEKKDAYATLGFCYQHGYGVRKIVPRAIEFYTLAAEQGSIDAAFNLGYIYHQHFNWKWNYREAFKWYTSAATNGNNAAQNGLAFLYLKGLGTNIDYSKALHWYTEAAKSRNINAMISLASIYRRGDILKQDYAKAAEWYTKAIQEGSTVAQNSLESLYSNKDFSGIENGPSSQKYYSKKGLCSKLHSDISRIPESAGLEKIKQLASFCMRGDGHAMLDIGRRYLQDARFPQDKYVAFKWIKNAAKAGLIEARLAVAQMYKYGDCIDQDYHKASIWYTRTSKTGDDKARYELGIMYHHGLGVRKDPLEASKWYTFSANKNNSDAQCQLGILRERGEGLKQDIEESIKLFYDATKQKNQHAIYKLAQVYEDGSGVKNNFDLALKLFGVAARLGSLDAQLKLAKTYGGEKYYDAQKAFKYYQLAADQGDPLAKYKTAVMYLNGKGIIQDLIKAYYLFKECSNIGYDKAINIFKIPIDYSKSKDIDYKKVEAMFVTVCRKEIDSLEYNLKNIYSQDFVFTYDTFLRSVSASGFLERTWCEKALEKGDPMALYEVGVSYVNKDNKASAQDLPKAIDYFQSAHEVGNINATFKLASMYLYGNGISQDLSKAFTLLNEASDKGHKEAYQILNISKIDSREEKYEAIKEMLELSAESGHVLSQYTLGTLTSDTNSLYYNIKNSIKWFEMASKGGLITAHYELGLLLELENPSEKEYQDIASLYRMAAEKGHNRASFRLAQLYHTGTKRDYVEAFRLYKLAAQQGHQSAQLATFVSSESMWERKIKQLPNKVATGELEYTSCFRMWEYVADQGNTELQYSLGMVYEEISANSTLSKAIKWYSRAAEYSHDLALYHLAQLYQNGRGTNQNYSQAIQYYKMAGDLGNNDALYQLGIMYQHGRGVIPDIKKSVDYYTQAAGKGNSAARFTLGRLYEDGEPFSKSILKAVKCYSISNSQGDEKAHNWLHDYYDEPYNSTFFYGRQFRILSRIVKISSNRNCCQNDEFLGVINYKLGHMYFYSYGTKLDYKKALEFFRKSSKLHDSDTTRFFSQIIHQEKPASSTEDYLKKLEMFEAAIEQLDLEDIYELGLIYYHGVNNSSEDIKTDEINFLVKSDHVKSVKYFRMIVNEQFSDDELCISSSYYLGMIHFVDIETTKDTGKAHYYLTKASHYRYSDAKTLLDYINQEETDKAAIFKRVFEWHKDNYDPRKLKMIYNLGFMYYKGLGTSQNYTEAIYYFNNAADQNHVGAQLELGYIYENGDGVEQDYAKSKEWYIKAANQHNTVAKYKLGHLYFNGKGVGIDYRSAFQHYKIAANQGHVESQTQLGYIYLKGHGVPRNYTKAIKWFSKGANKNNVISMHNLGDIYYDGTGIDVNYILAFQYYESAAIQGYANSQLRLGLMYSAGHGIELNRIKAIEWYIKAADQNNAWASYNLGNAYSDGKDVEEDYELAFKYYKAAADQGNAAAQNQLGDIFENGYGVDKDYNKAVEWYTKAANQNNIEAICNLGDIYYYDDGVGVDYKLAFQYYETAANQGHARAQDQLGELYENGYGVDKDDVKALEWYTKGANQNEGNSNYSMGYAHFYGEGAEQDYQLAFQYYQIGADQGDPDAQYDLAEMYYRGLGVEKNSGEALNICLSIEDKDGYAWGFLGEIYHSADPQFQDFSKALECYKLAVEENMENALRGLGLLYEHGDGVDRDYKKALDYYTLSQNEGSTVAYYNIALLYYHGKGVTKNFISAFEFFERVAEGDFEKDYTHVLVEDEYDDDANLLFDQPKKKYSFVTEAIIYGEAHFYLGVMNDKGQGTSQDHQKALDHFKLSHSHGIEKAKSYLEI